MAAPTINFSTTPILGKMLYFDLKIFPFQLSTQPFNLNCGMHLLKKAQQLVNASSRITIRYSTISVAQVPKPPVGKMLIATYPPIYKERTNYTGVAETPREFPPIFINHISGLH